MNWYNRIRYAQVWEVESDESFSEELKAFYELEYKYQCLKNFPFAGMDRRYQNIFKNVEDRSTRSIVRLRNNETLFLGGLIRRDDVKTVTKVPFLGDIPLLGSLFRHKDTTGTGARELVIFLTPHILEEGESQIEKAKVLPREQQNSSKESSVKIALDSCNR